MQADANPRPDDKDEFFRHILDSMQCCHCNNPYEAENVQILGQEAKFWILAARCQVCGLRGLVVALLDDSGYGLLTTVGNQDEQAAEETLPPTEAEVEAWGHFLSDFTGDMRDLLALLE